MMDESSTSIPHTTPTPHTTTLDPSLRCVQDNPLHLQNLNCPGMEFVSDSFNETGFDN